MSSAFRLEVASGGLATLTFDSPDRRVNVFDRATLAELESLVSELASRDDLSCLVLVSTKPKSFIASANVELIAAVTNAAKTEAKMRLGQQIFAAWKALPFPTVTAIASACLGDSTKLSLASTWQVMANQLETRIGLPETQLRIIPA